MKSFTIPSIFTAMDKLSPVISKMQKSVSAFINRSEEEIARFDRRMRRLGNAAHDVAKKSAVVGLALLAPLVLAAHSAIEFEDNMADIAKTTGLAGKNLEQLGQGILDVSTGTRTSIEELQKIGAIGGSLHVAEKDLLPFIQSVNQFNVALGSDFSGGVEAATKAIGGLKNLFKETRDLNFAEAITKAGSAFNSLSSQGVNVPELNEFVSRIGQLPDAIKPSIQSTAALGAVFNKSGLSAEIASRAFGDILLTGAANLSKFAKQMNMTESAAAKLINTDPVAFATKFAESLKGLDAQKLSGTLKALKLTDAGAIKVVGALGSQTEMLTQFQKIANEEFAKGTSLLDEYTTKNNTTKGKLSQIINNLKAFSITVGTQLLPVLNDLIKQITPVLKGFLQWAKNNPGTVKAILYLTLALSALSFIVSGVSSAIWIGSKVMMAFNHSAKLVTAAQWLWNAAMAANPIGLIILGVIALTALIVIIIRKWNDWGAALTTFMGPLGLIISLVQSFRRNWDLIKEAFKTEGVLAGLKMIGKTILDAVLMPMQQFAGIIAQVTGFEWAENAVKNIEKLRNELEVNTKTDESGNPLPGQKTPAINPESRRQETYKKLFGEQTNNAHVQLDVVDPFGLLKPASAQGDFVKVVMPRSRMPIN